MKSTKEYQIHGHSTKNGGPISKYHCIYFSLPNGKLVCLCVIELQSAILWLCPLSTPSFLEPFELVKLFGRVCLQL